MQLGGGHFWLGDCFDLFARVPDGSVDMVLCDLPYGTTQNKWDSVLPLNLLWSEYWRVAKPNAAIVLTAAQPFTTALGASQIEQLRYSWVWEKTNATGHLNAKIQPMRLHEDVLVFCKTSPPYFPQGLVSCDKIVKRGGNGDNFGVSGTQNHQTQTNYPRSIIRFPTDAKGLHPTQKPVALFEYLIRTYTNPGDVVLDNTAGSGTTAIAAENTGRRWICMEREEEYYNRAIVRVMETLERRRAEGYT